MITLDFEQGSPEWFAARCGRPTASEFDRIITPGGKRSTQADGLMYKLLAEMVTGHPAVFTESDWMKRGRELEAEARAALEFHVDHEIAQVGFIYSDERHAVGCSPDGLYADGGCEIKCPSPAVHVQYLLGQTIPSDYYPQVQGAMYATGAPWWDFWSYHPDMPPLYVRVKRDDPYIAKMGELIEMLLIALNEKRTRLIQLGYLPAPHVAAAIPDVVMADTP